MNVLFALYGDFTSNSATHVAQLADELIALGCDCTVAVPAHPESIVHLGKTRFRDRLFSAALADGGGFRDGRGPDVVHGWTPREPVREFCTALRARHPEARLVLHLEDHELHLLETKVGHTLDELLALPAPELDRIAPPELTHPRRGPRFLQEADLVTVLVDRLRELVPAEVPCQVLWPAADARFFHPRPLDRAFRRSLGLAPDATVLAYNGNVHESNAAEVRSLYVATALLNRSGQPTQLLRTGRDFTPFLGADDSWARPFTIHLGHFSNYQQPVLLAMADYLVQPGRPGRFNDYRFPSKLPEFFALGRPVILPRTNLGLVTRHLEDAYVLDRADGESIAAAVRHLRADPALAAHLAEGALAFAARHFRWPDTAQRLLTVYRELVPAAAHA